jgi:hypothetical protein
MKCAKQSQRNILAHWDQPLATEVAKPRMKVNAQNKADGTFRNMRAGKTKGRRKQIGGPCSSPLKKDSRLS